MRHPHKISKATVRNLIQLAQRLPANQQLPVGDVELHIINIHPGIFITRMQEQDIRDAAWELNEAGHRIAVLPSEVFAFAIARAGVWWAMKRTLNRIVEPTENSRAAMKTLNLAYPDRFNPYKISIELFFGRHNYGVTIEDADELSRQLLEAQPQ